MWRAALEQQLERIATASRQTEGKVNGKADSSEWSLRCLRALLSPAGWVYGALVKGRNALFDREFFKSYEVPLPVVSVGNLVVGGGGKTPLTRLLAQSLQPHTPVAILCRGYRAQAEKRAQPLVVSRGEGPEWPVEVMGDEAFLLASSLPKTLLVAGRDRVAAALLAQELGASLLLLDDGMQHRRLARSFEIVVMQASSPFGSGLSRQRYFLPRGRLRDDPQRLWSADAVVMYKSSQAGRDVLQSVEGWVKPYFGPETELLWVETRATQLGLVENQQPLRERVPMHLLSLSELKDMPVALLCGIASPQRFEESIESLGAKVIDRAFDADHASFVPDKVQAYVDGAKQKGAKLVVCTEKDRQKLSYIPLSLPLASLDIEVVVQDQEQWDVLIERIRKLR